MKVAIDASNIRTGGGATHLIECLTACDPAHHGIDRVTVFCDKSIAARLPAREWLHPKSPELLNRGSLSRMWWRHMRLTQEVKREFDILLVPGGSYLGDFKPFVTLAQNLLPFDNYERAREGITLKRLRLHLLEVMQSRTIRRADGVIYMSDISRSHIEDRIAFRAPRSRVVHHGTAERFFRDGPAQQTLGGFSKEKPFRLLYVSILEPYKHQDVVVEAVAILRSSGLPVRLDLVGPGSVMDRVAMAKLLHRVDPEKSFVFYHGAVAYADLGKFYSSANSFVFASSCETFGIILLEAMAGGLPIICSHRSAMPEIVGAAAMYFDPLSPTSLARTVRRVFESDGIRRSLAFQARERARLFDWKRCADETFGFVREINDQHAKGKPQ